MAALWPIAPDRIRLDRDRSGQLVYDTLNKSAPNTVLLPSEIFHLHGLGFDGIQGYSVIALARHSIGMGLAAEEYGARFFANDATPGGVVEHPLELRDEARKHIKEDWQKIFAGKERHSIAVLEEGMKYHQIGLSNEDAQFLETRRFQVQEICRWFRVPPHKLADLERATFCLPASELVFAEGGPKSIADLQPGEKVWSMNGVSGRLHLSVVEASVCSGEDEILELRTTNRMVRCNAAHKILARRKYPAPTGGPGGYQSIRWETEYIPAGDLRVGDTIVVLKNLPTAGTHTSPTREVSVEFMEFCGLLLGDGNINKDHGVTIARGESALYMDHYRAVMQREFQSFGRAGNGRTRNLETVAVTLTEGERQTRFASVLAAEELTACGFAGTARTKTVPDWIFLLTVELRLAFVRGYLDADGHVDKKGRISFASVNEYLLSQIRHLCMSCGIPVTNAREQQATCTLPNGELFEAISYTFTCSNPEENCRIWSHDPRYQQRLKDGQPFEKKGRAYPRYGGEDFESEGCELSRIVSIALLSSEPVYDLQVAGHSFIANGIIVHNSNIEHQAIEFVVDTLVPWAMRLEQEANIKFFGLNRQTLFTKLNVASLLRGDMSSRYAAYATGRQWGWLSVNDVRRLEDQNPLPPHIGDLFLIPTNMYAVPLDGTQPTIGPPLSPHPPRERPQDPEDVMRAVLAAQVDAHRNGTLSPGAST
ncbi:MAG: portal protein [Nitrospira sp.]|nr:MAG: portal protein [Nitrospira sp.]